MPSRYSAVIRKIENDIAGSVDYLGKRLTVKQTQTHTHLLLEIDGLVASEDCLNHMAVYCVGQLAKVIQVNLHIRADLLNSPRQHDIRRYLLKAVYSVVGSSNSRLSLIQKRDERDPWLFEALSHLIVHLSKRKHELFPVGSLIGLTMTHNKVKEQGLDLVAIYAGTKLGLSVGESKAWEDRPSEGLAIAAGKFRKVDLGEYDSELRSIVSQMRDSMPPNYRSQITGMFWEEERAYFPFLGYDSVLNPRWFQSRKPLSKLKVPHCNRVLVPLPISEFRKFFDKLSDAMRRYVKSL